MARVMRTSALYTIQKCKGRTGHCTSIRNEAGLHLTEEEDICVDWM